MTLPHVVFLAGASGAGKTTLVKELAKRSHDLDKIAFLYFDSIGEPSLEEMIEEYGSGKGWQKSKTYEWIERIAQEYANHDVVFIEGQTELTFVKDALEKNNLSSYTILLVHANPKELHDRLINERQQADLVNAEMDNWANYLMNQAKMLECQIINTSEQDLESAICFLESFIKL